MYIFEYLFQVCSRFIVGAPSYEEENIKGKIAIVTGANSGLGKATSFELAKRGATVVLAGRNYGKLIEAVEEIKSRTPNGKLVILLAIFGPRRVCDPADILGRISLVRSSFVK